MGVAGQGRVSGDQAWIDSRGEGGEGEKAPGQGLEAAGKKGGVRRVMKVCVLPTAATTTTATTTASGIAREQGLVSGMGTGLGPTGCVDVDVAVGVELVGMGLMENYEKASDDQGVGAGVGMGDEYVESAVGSAKRLMEGGESEEGTGSESELASESGLGLGLGEGSVAMIRARYSLEPVTATNVSTTATTAADAAATSATATTATSTDALTPLTGNWSCAVPRHILSLSSTPLTASTSASEGGGGGVALVSDANETKETFLTRVMQYTIQVRHCC